MSLDEHRVLYSLGQPFRILKWTIPEFACMAVPMVAGFALDELVLGALGGLGLRLGYAKCLKRLGLMSGWMYWTVSLTSFSRIPPSWIRVVGR